MLSIEQTEQEKGPEIRIELPLLNLKIQWDREATFCFLEAERFRLRTETAFWNSATGNVSLGKVAALQLQFKRALTPGEDEPEAERFEEGWPGEDREKAVLQLARVLHYFLYNDSPFNLVQFVDQAWTEEEQNRKTWLKLSGWVLKAIDLLTTSQLPEQINAAWIQEHLTALVSQTSQDEPLG